MYKYSIFFYVRNCQKFSELVSALLEGLQYQRDKRKYHKVFGVLPNILFFKAVQAGMNGFSLSLNVKKGQNCANICRS
jgi:hypothetical protein